MERYMTTKAERIRWWEAPVAGLSIMFGSIAIQVWIEDAATPGDVLIDFLANLTVVTMMLLPLGLVFLRWVRRRQARELAKRLARRSEAELPLDGLDRALGLRGAARKIKRLASKGYLRRVEVDEAARVLRLEQPAQPEPPEPEEAPAPQFDGVISEIRRLNDEIDDALLSERIDRLERVTASILLAVEERPERAEEARRFMNYYLPTTLRLLESYRMMEKQSYQGENIQASRRRIEEVLEKLVYAAEQQQDKLFRAEALDVEAEIKVMETMMASEGLGIRE